MKKFTAAVRIKKVTIDCNDNTCCHMCKAFGTEDIVRELIEREELESIAREQ